MPAPIQSCTTRRRLRQGALSLPMLFVLQACGGETSGRSSDAPTWDEAANATYAGVYDTPVTLVDGAYAGEPFVEGAAARPRLGLVRDFILVGDLDGDGTSEAAFLLWENSGGTGTFTYLAVLATTPGRVENRGVALVGDRVQVRSAGIRSGAIALDVVQGGKSDAACCPGQKVVRSWTLGPAGLSELAPVDDGRFSLGDLAGREWVLRYFGWEDPAPPEPEITLVFDGERIAGFSGCNSYFASVVAGEGVGLFTIGPTGMTMMACDEAAMDLEQRYQRLLSNVGSYGFVAGRLALTSVVADDVTILLFDGRQPAED